MKALKVGDKLRSLGQAVKGPKGQKVNLVIVNILHMQ